MIEVDSALNSRGLLQESSNRTQGHAQKRLIVKICIMDNLNNLVRSRTSIQFSITTYELWLPFGALLHHDQDPNHIAIAKKFPFTKENNTQA